LFESNFINVYLQYHYNNKPFEVIRRSFVCVLVLIINKNFIYYVTESCYNEKFSFKFIQKYNFYLLIYHSDLYSNYENIDFSQVTAHRREEEKLLKIL
jgi:hypothetical protein